MLVLFGSVAKGDWHEYRDADVCVVVTEPEIVPLDHDWWMRVYRLSDGVVQPHIYGFEQFLRMVDAINGLAIEVVHDGIALAGDESYWEEVRRRFRAAQEHYRLQKVPGGWNWDPTVAPL